MWQPPDRDISQQDSLVELIDGVKSFAPRLEDFAATTHIAINSEIRRNLPIEQRWKLEQCHSAVDDAVSSLLQIEQILTKSFLERQEKIEEERQICASIAREQDNGSESYEGIGEELATSFLTMKVNPQAPLKEIRECFASLATRHAETIVLKGGPNSSAIAHCCRRIASEIRDRSAIALFRPFKALQRFADKAASQQEWPRSEVAHADAEPAPAPPASVSHSSKTVHRRVESFDGAKWFIGKKDDRASPISIETSQTEYENETNPRPSQEKNEENNSQEEEKSPENTEHPPSPKNEGNEQQ